jgi:aldehyde dehydrogenase (NAD+)
MRNTPTIPKRKTRRQRETAAGSHAKTLERAGVHGDEHSGAAAGARWLETRGPALGVRCPVDGSTLATIRSATPVETERVIDAAHEAFLTWRLVPAPKRGEFVRRIGNKLRQRKADLAALVTLEAGKITQEALGEVQEMIDVCDFAVGLSRQLYGLTIASERPGHRMMEQWHPLGVVGVITAFNFPVAVWAWNAMLALVCGDAVVWKPSEKTPLTALACHRLVMEVVEESGDLAAPPAVVGLTVGDASTGETLAKSERIPLVSATGSTRMGRAVATTVARRLGRCLLELGGNNGMILAPSADLDLAVRAITFAAAGTAGQRCTTLRRLIVHNSIGGDVTRRLSAVFERLPVGDPRDAGVLVGPLVDERAYDSMQAALAAARKDGGTVHGGGRVTAGVPAGGCYVRPAIVEMPHPNAPIVCEETFAPILYVLRYDTLDEALALHNAVPQGLSSAIFTSDVREAELFLSPAGSDCGIANVNIGTSGAEIGGAFGGEKQTGGGRESGSDAWKSYMRRATNTINYSHQLPLAQGIEFGA